MKEPLSLLSHTTWLSNVTDVSQISPMFIKDEKVDRLIDRVTEPGLLKSTRGVPLAAQTWPHHTAHQTHQGPHLNISAPRQRANTRKCFVVCNKSNNNSEQDNQGAVDTISSPYSHPRQTQNFCILEKYTKYTNAFSKRNTLCKLHKSTQSKQG